MTSCWARQPQKRMNLPLFSRFLAFPHCSSGDVFGVWARGELAAPEGWSHRVPAAGASPSHGATRSTHRGPTEGTEPSPCATPSPELAGLVLNPALPAGAGCKNGICVGCDEDEHHHEAQHHLVDKHHSKDEHHPEAPSITPRPSTPPRCCGSRGGWQRRPSHVPVYLRGRLEFCILRIYAFPLKLCLLPAPRACLGGDNAAPCSPRAGKDAGTCLSPTLQAPSPSPAPFPCTPAPGWGPILMPCRPPPTLCPPGRAAAPGEQGREMPPS